tara:strand:+ start:9675 stop:9968 length:294 start_codon:yes stop_codon:yes gene_type:complete
MPLQWLLGLAGVEIDRQHGEWASCQGVHGRCGGSAPLEVPQLSPTSYNKPENAENTMKLSARPFAQKTTAAEASDNHLAFQCPDHPQPPIAPPKPTQ